MPFKVLGEEINLLKKVGEFRNQDGVVIGYDHDSVIYFKDDIVQDEDISPSVIEQYDKGDANTRSLIVRVDKRGRPLDTPPPAKEEEEEAPVLVSKDKTAQGVVSTETAEGPLSPKKKVAKPK